MSDQRARLYILTLLAIAVMCTVLVIRAGRTHGWEGDDGGLDNWEVQVGRYATRLNNQMQLATPPSPPPTTLPPVPSWPWDALAQCESGGNWSINTGNGYYGGLQFTLTSWRGVGGTGYPHHHTREEQIRRGIALQQLQGWGAWPACSRKIGLR